jgi:hypothetical protein
MLLKKVGYVFAEQLTNSIIVFVFNIICLRNLDSSEYGYISNAYAVLGLFQGSVIAAYYEGLVIEKSRFPFSKRFILIIFIISLCSCCFYLIYGVFEWFQFYLYLPAVFLTYIYYYLKRYKLFKSSEKESFISTLIAFIVFLIGLGTLEINYKSVFFLLLFSYSLSSVYLLIKSKGIFIFHKKNFNYENNSIKLSLYFWLASNISYFIGLKFDSNFVGDARALLFFVLPFNQIILIMNNWYFANINLVNNFMNKRLQDKKIKLLSVILIFILFCILCTTVSYITGREIFNFEIVLLFIFGMFSIQNSRLMIKIKHAGILALVTKKIPIVLLFNILTLTISLTIFSNKIFFILVLIFNILILNLFLKRQYVKI